MTDYKGRILQFPAFEEDYTLHLVVTTSFSESLIADVVETGDTYTYSHLDGRSGSGGGTITEEIPVASEIVGLASGATGGWVQTYARITLDRWRVFDSEGVEVNRNTIAFTTPAVVTATLTETGTGADSVEGVIGAQDVGKNILTDQYRFTVAIPLGQVATASLVISFTPPEGIYLL